MPRLSVALFLTVLLMLHLSGCANQDSSTNADSSFDNLTLGTGLNPANPSQLTGEGTTFKGANKDIWWRLQSTSDMTGQSVKIKIEEPINGVYTTFQTNSYSSPQNYGHIIIASFSLPVTGSFRATGILVASNRSVASRDFTVQP